MRTTLAKNRLARLLARKLDLQDPRFRFESMGARLSGSVISPSFEGKTDYDRQRMIWDALEAEFGRRSVELVGTILAYTPAEWEIDLAGPPPRIARTSQTSRAPRRRPAPARKRAVR